MLIIDVNKSTNNVTVFDWNSFIFLTKSDTLLNIMIINYQRADKHDDHNMSTVNFVYTGLLFVHITHISQSASMSLFVWKRNAIPWQQNGMLFRDNKSECYSVTTKVLTFSHTMYSQYPTASTK
jgi:hypothetical protein